MTTLSVLRIEMRLFAGLEQINTILSSYALTAGTCMLYLVLKLVWWFHLRHQPVGDEEDNDNHETKML